LKNGSGKLEMQSFLLLYQNPASIAACRQR